MKIEIADTKNIIGHTSRSIIRKIYFIVVNTISSVDQFDIVETRLGSKYKKTLKSSWMSILNKILSAKYPIVINSIPKSGTNLVTNIVNAAPNTRRMKTIKQNFFMNIKPHWRRHGSVYRNKWCNIGGVAEVRVGDHSRGFACQWIFPNLSSR